MEVSLEEKIRHTAILLCDGSYHAMINLLPCLVVLYVMYMYGVSGGGLPQRVREKRSARRAAHPHARCKKKSYTYSELYTWCGLSPVPALIGTACFGTRYIFAGHIGGIAAKQ